MNELESALHTIALALGIDIEIKGKVQEGQQLSKGFNVLAMQMFNNILNTKFSPTTAQTASLLKKLREAGFTPDDVKLVVESKKAEWQHDDKMKQYLRPTTLLQEAKFEAYLEAAKAMPTNRQYELMKDDWE